MMVQPCIFTNLYLRFYSFTLLNNKIKMHYHCLRGTMIENP
uniref:Uncharacterized protein n=1 Tax=Lepeophtheirus salmonis TaxID=72036 RepID=A0A0K2UPR8_LEPSM